MYVSIFSTTDRFYQICILQFSVLFVLFKYSDISFVLSPWLFTLAGYVRVCSYKEQNEKKVMSNILPVFNKAICF